MERRGSIAGRKILSPARCPAAKALVEHCYPYVIPAERRGTMPRSPRRYPDLDLDRMFAACAWAFPLQPTDTPEQRQEKIHIHEELLAGFLRTFPNNPPHEIDGTPYRVDRGLLNQVAGMVLLMSTEEDRVRPWRPILDLGPAADNWVEPFLTDVFSRALQHASLLDDLEVVWRSMLDYAFASPIWNPTDGRGHFHLHDLWEHLLGIDSIVASKWEDTHRPLLERMKPYKKWAEKYLTDDRRVSGFVHFLQRKAADPFLLEGLAWLAPVWQQLKPSGYVHESDESTFAEFLLFLWEKQ
jgi:hypothetical protein